jgi:hypothetical protein
VKGCCAGDADCLPARQSLASLRQRIECMIVGITTGMLMEAQVGLIGPPEFLR